MTEDMKVVENLLAKAEGESKKEILEQLDALATACEEKLGIPSKDVISKYTTEYAALQRVLKGATPDVLARRTFVKIKGLYGQELRSPALIMHGMTLGVSEPFDMVRSQRAAAMLAWNENPQDAVKKGICDPNGVPLDTKPAFSSGKQNPNFGKPLPDHSFIRNVVGIVDYEGKMKLFTMPLGDRLVDVPVVGMTPYTFRANVSKTQNNPKVLALNPYSRIEFQRNEADIGKMLQEHADLYERYRMVLADIKEYHAKVSGDPQRFCIFEADVMYIDAQPNPTTGNRMVVLADESLPPDHPGITAWIPGSIPVDFGAGSRIVGCGATAETSFQADEGMNYIINVTGVYAIPELKVPADEVPKSAVRQVK